MTQRPERSGFEFGKLEFVWDLGHLEFILGSVSTLTFDKAERRFLCVRSRWV